jgi:hypothetical protein
MERTVISGVVMVVIVISSNMGAVCETVTMPWLVQCECTSCARR